MEITKDDISYFLKSTYNIDIDELQQKILLNNIPQTNLISDNPINIESIDWTPSNIAGIYLYIPTENQILDSIKTGRNIVIIIDKKKVNDILPQLNEYKKNIYQTDGNLAMIHCEDYDICRKSVGGAFIPSVINWSSYIDQ